MNSSNQGRPRGGRLRRRFGCAFLAFASIVLARDPVDYVNPLIGTAASRWDYFSSACRPFGLVNLSPDTKVGTIWQSGYVYGEQRILCFSHVHGFLVYGVPAMPSVGEFHAPEGLAAGSSPFSHADEVVSPGYHRVGLQRYGITAELTATTRVGFHRYTFPASAAARIAFNTCDKLEDAMAGSALRQVSPTEFAGHATMAPTQPPRRPKACPVYFVIRFSKPVQFGAWAKGVLQAFPAREIAGPDVGAYAEFATAAGEQVLMKVALSYTSEENARRNLEAELPGWDFDAVRQAARTEWNDWLSRVTVEGGTEAQRVKFYTDLWHTLFGRTISSDADGSYSDRTGEKPVIRRVARDAQGRPLYPHFNFDTFWGGHWSVGLLWSFAYPEVMDRFCWNMVDVYRDSGLIPRGMSGGDHCFVMIGDPAAPFFAAAYNKGIRGFDAEQAYAGLRRNALPGGLRDHAGYELGADACGGGMKYYVERGYIPEDIEGGGMHKDGAAMTLEYAYEDWCLAQLADALGKADDAAWLTARAGNYANLWDPAIGLIRPRQKDGTWLPGFTGLGEKGTFTAKGFCESNSHIYSHFVPQDLPGLIGRFGGAKAYAAILNDQFERAAPDRFVAPFAEYAAEYVSYDNQPGTAMAHLFNFAGAPWLSQKWVREVKARTFGDVTPAGGYSGDEDEGQMGALGVLMAIGLFDVQGGAARMPTYQITAPLFERVTIKLNPDYFPGKEFVILAHHASPQNVYIQSARLNGRPLDQWWFPHSDLVRGGTLELDLGPAPSRWAADAPPPPSARPSAAPRVPLPPKLSPTP